MSLNTAFQMAGGEPDVFFLIIEARKPIVVVAHKKKMNHSLEKLLRIPFYSSVPVCCRLGMDTYYDIKSVITS